MRLRDKTLFLIYTDIEETLAYLDFSLKFFVTKKINY